MDSEPGSSSSIYFIAKIQSSYKRKYYDNILATR